MHDNNNNTDDDDGPDGAAAAAARVNTDETQKGDFQFPENAVDLIGMMLDPDIRAARDHVHEQIENGQIGQGGVNIEGVGIQNRGLTKSAQTVAKVVTDIHAIRKQAQRNMKRR